MSRNAWIWIGLLLLAFVAGDWFASHRAASTAAFPASTSTPSPREAPVPLPRAEPAPMPDASGLPAEARDTLALIARGGPFEHRQDGAVFQNREHRLPSRPRGWYREYTVETPGSDDRGARRIVTGGTPPGEYWYSDDHYRSFRRIDAQGASR
ncbi:MAG: ribonuclease domain-containing protein [Thermomonas sp.]